MGFSRQEYWSGLPCPPPGDLPTPVNEPPSPMTPALQADSLPLNHRGRLMNHRRSYYPRCFLVLPFCMLLLKNCEICADRSDKALRAPFVHPLCPLGTCVASGSGGHSSACTVLNTLWAPGEQRPCLIHPHSRSSCLPCAISLWINKHMEKTLQLKGSSEMGAGPERLIQKELQDRTPSF